MKNQLLKTPILKAHKKAIDETYKTFSHLWWSYEKEINLLLEMQESASETELEKQIDRIFSFFYELRRCSGRLDQEIKGFSDMYASYFEEQVSTQKKEKDN